VQPNDIRGHGARRVRVGGVAGCVGGHDAEVVGGRRAQAGAGERGDVGADGADQREGPEALVARSILNPVSLIALSVHERLICDEETAPAASRSGPRGRSEPVR